jgi:hypothetical protein
MTQTDQGGADRSGQAPASNGQEEMEDVAMVAA